MGKFDKNYKVSNFRLNARKPKGNAGLPTPKGELFLLYVEDIVSMPEADAKGIVTNGDIKIKAGRRFHTLYLTPTTQEYNRKTEGEADSRGWKQSIKGNYPGDALEVNEFVRNNVNQGFVIVEHSCNEYKKIYGSKSNPLYFTGNFKDDKDSKGYDLTFEQEFKDHTPVLFYYGNVIVDENALDPEDLTELFDGLLTMDKAELVFAQKDDVPTIQDIKNLYPLNNEW